MYNSNKLLVSDPVAAQPSNRPSNAPVKPSEALSKSAAAAAYHRCHMLKAVSKPLCISCLCRDVTS